MSDRLLSHLRSAHEHLCAAEVDLPPGSHRSAIGDAIASIQRAGVMFCPEWSSCRLPTTDDPQ